MARYRTTLGQAERMLILAKTYPTPSRGHVETTCVAAVSAGGELRRVFPVPFRLLPDDQQFSKWQWITASFRPPTDDQRPESRRIDVDSLTLGERVVKGRNADWAERMRWIEPHILPSFAALEGRRQATGETLGFLRPSRLLGLDITLLPAAERDWDEEEREKLTRDLEQGDLFTDPGEAGRRRRAMLEKLPFHVHYRYEIDRPNGPEQNRHLVTDWEAGTLYRNCVRSHGANWQEPFRAKMEEWMAGRDLVFMMGTQHRFPNQWLVISLIYPPRPIAERPGSITQASLDL